MKDFLLIANKNCITYKEFFHLIKDRLVNIGYTHPGDFDQPEEDTHKSMQGLTRWFTTLSTASKPPLILTATYSPEKYPKYDNYDAINVDKVKDIPYDYDGVMGVPITILDHNLDNVEIQGLFMNGNVEGEDGLVCGRDVSNYNLPGTQNGPVVMTSKGPEAKYKRVLIKKNFEIDGCLYWDHTIIDGTYIKGHTPEIDGKHKYSRILIKKKYSPEQFEIIGGSMFDDTSIRVVKHYQDDGYKFLKADGITESGSGALRDKTSPKIPGKYGTDYSVGPDGKCLTAIYQRIFIRRKKSSPTTPHTPGE